MKDVLKDLPPSSLVQTRIWMDYDGLVNVAWEPFNPSVKVVVDETAMKSFNSELSERLAGHNPKDPNVIGFLKEYSEKWLDEMWRLNYVILEDISEKEMSGESLYKPWKYKPKTR